MVRSLAVLMDAIESIKVAKDTSFALLLEAERRGYRIHYLTQGGPRHPRWYAVGATGAAFGAG
jgi:hypothetical protein